MTMEPLAGHYALRGLGLAEWLRRRCRMDPDRPALSFEGGCWTYRELLAETERYAAVLAAGGLKHGDRVAYLGLNHPSLLIALFASARLGAIFVPLNFRLTAAELAGILGDAAPHTLIAAGSHLDRIDTIRDGLGCRRYLGLDGVTSGWECLPEVLTNPGPPPPAADLAADDTAVIMFTSGTTGRAKGAMLTHANLWANNVNWSLAVEFAASDIALNSAPLFHVGGLCVVVLPVLMAGGHVILKSGFDAVDTVTSIAQARVTVAFGMPAMLQAMTETSDFATSDLSSLRLVIAGGASVPASLLRTYEARGIPISQGWGMTETATTVTFLSPRQAAAKLGSCGLAAMLSEFRLIDLNGDPITEPDVKGEICARGPNVTPGYWNRPDAKAEAFDRDGWFRSGDIGFLDRDGHLYVCDRLKDMIISGGENIYPAEIEGVLCAHPAIAEIAVIGAPDPRWGERVVAVVALRPGAALSLDELQKFARQSLAGCKIPRELRLVGALPRNPSGKVLKTDLRGAS